MADLSPINPKDIPWLNMMGTLRGVENQPDALSPMMPMNPAPSPVVESSNPWLDLQKNVETSLSPQAPSSMVPMKITTKTSGTSFNPATHDLMSGKIDGLEMQKQGLAELEAAKDKLPTGAQGTDLTGLMMLADAWGDKSGRVFTGGYKAPQTAAERDAVKRALELQIQKAKQGLTDDEVNILKAQLGVKQHQMMQGMLNDKKAEDNDEKDRWALIKWYDTEKGSGRFAPAVKARANLNQADRIQGLINQYHDDPNKMPLEGPSSLSEVAIGLNGLLGQNGGSDASRRSLIPASARGKASTIEQFFANKPTPAEMGEFVKNAEETLHRERQVNAKQVQGFLEKANAVTGGGRFARRNPQAYQQLTDSFLNDPSLQPASTSASGKPETITQGGFTYKLNPKTGDYE